MIKSEIIGAIANLTNKAEAIVNELERIGALNITYGNKDVGDIVEAFKQGFGSTKTSKWDRFAANRLAKKHGSGNVVAVIQVMAAAQNQPYCPVINSVSELETKWVSVANFIQRNRIEEEMRF